MRWQVALAGYLGLVYIVGMTWTLDAEYALGQALRVRRFVWPNGLRVLLLRDRAAPIFSYQTWFRVGSRNERPGATGMAHFFEHLMFGETANQPAGAFDSYIEQAGGDNNAATWTDWTFYRTSLPKSELRLAAALESDRMRHLALTDEQVETERGVIISERKERVDDDVDGFLDERLNALAFQAHPYGWPTIGWMDDIRALSRSDMHAFYRTYYAPNNATIVLVGDVEEAQALDVIAEHYGDIPPAALPEVAAADEPVQTEERVLLLHKPVSAERLLVGYKVPGQGHPDWAVLDFIAALLCAGPSSRLTRALKVDAQVAISVDASVMPFRDPTLLRFAVNTTRDHSAEQALACIDEAVARLADEPVDERELRKIKNGVETDFWMAMEDCDGKAEAFGHYETTLGDFRELFHMADRLAGVTAEDIQRVARSYLLPERRTVVIAKPDRRTPDQERA